MKLFRPSDLLAYLEELGASPQKRFSQNFLIDGNVIAKIVRTADVQEGESVLEIGPGPGALTQGLLERGARVIAIEKDALFAQGLEKLQLRYPHQLHVVQGDVLAFDLKKLAQKKCKVVAKFLPEYERFSTLTLMVQKEVGERMTAKEGEKNRSRLSLLTEIYAHSKLCFTVSPSSFYPKPKVTSCVMHLALHLPPMVSSLEGLLTLIKAAFSQKRKTLRATFKEAWGKERLESTLAALGIAPNARPQELSLKQWISFFEALEISRQSAK